MIIIFTIWVGSGAEKKGKFAVSQVQCLLCCSLVLEDTSLGES